MRIGNKKKTLSQIILITLGICVLLISSIEFNAYDNNPENLQENNVIIEASTLLIYSIFSLIESSFTKDKPIGLGLLGLLVAKTPKLCSLSGGLTSLSQPIASLK